MLVPTGKAFEFIHAFIILIVGRVSVVLLCPVLSSGRTGSEKFVHAFTYERPNSRCGRIGIAASAKSSDHFFFRTKCNRHRTEL